MGECDDSTLKCVDKILLKIHRNNLISMCIVEINYYGKILFNADQ